MLRLKLFIGGLIIHFSFQAIAQQDSSQVQDITKIPIDKYFESISKQAGSLQGKLDKKSKKELEKYKKLEEKLAKKLAKVDSIKAKNILIDGESGLRQLEEKLKTDVKLTQYIPKLDSLITSLKFLSTNSKWLDQIKDGKQKLDDASDKLKELQANLQKAENIKQFLKERKQYLNEQLKNLGFVKELKKLNKQAYYFSQQVNEYKEALKDSKKAERKALELLSKTKLFQDFMKKNSMLASLFRMPSDPNDPVNFSLLSGLQTRSQVTALIQNQIATGGRGAQQLFQQNIQQAQSELNQVKNKVLKMGDGGGETAEGFNPNDQKTKTFFERLEFGSNIQSQRARYMFPVTTDLGLSLGYKLNNKSIVGIGASYKMGWGNGFNNVRITHQGISIRSFVDWKIKGSFWISGGYEQNYKTEMRNITQLRDRSAWQQSGLLGISKVIVANTKFFKKTKVQLLWDFLSYQQIPRSQPILFRVGYNF